MLLKGKVVLKTVARGSKSEHIAPMLVTSDRELVLRRQGGNPFRDPELDSLVGLEIEVEGQQHDYAFIFNHCRVTEKPKPPEH